MARWRACLRDSIIEPAIGRDILMMEPVRKPALLRQLFLVCLGHPAESISLQKLVGELHTAGAMETVAHYLDVLEQAYLVAGLELRRQIGITGRRWTTRATPAWHTALQAPPRQGRGLLVQPQRHFAAANYVAVSGLASGVRPETSAGAVRRC